jgi:hypothetical protein
MLGRNRGCGPLRKRRIRREKERRWAAGGRWARLGRGEKEKRKEGEKRGFDLYFLFFIFNPFKTKLSNLLLLKPFQVSKSILKTLNHTTKNKSTCIST